MILTGPAITAAVRDGRITIDPFDEALVGPNSVDFRLGDRCKVYRDRALDAAIDNPTEDLPVPPEGIVLDPARVYLFNTLERIGSATYVPIIRGRSSVGRLGVFTNITADLIDLGSINQLTLQMHAVIPARVYPGMRIGQVTFWAVEGPVTHLYHGKYADAESPVPSRSWREFGASEKPRK